MFRIQDFNPVLKTPSGLLPIGNSNNNNSNNGQGNINNNNNISSFNMSNNLNSSHNQSSHYNQHYAQPISQSQPLLSDEKALTFTNYYKFCSLTNVNCYFYQFDSLNSSTGNTNLNSAGSTYEILKYEQIIKQKLKNDYQINDIITWIAKKELCLFQLQVEDQSENFNANVGFNQLRDAMSNIISENNMSLKLISASTFDANKIFRNNSSNQNTTQNQIQKKSLNVVYLSFLRAVHKYVLQKMTKPHSLFEASNQSLSIDILPYSGQLIVSSMIQKSIVTSQNNIDPSLTSKKKKVLRKLVPYSILKISPSLNQKNELIINMTSLKKVFYKLTDYITINCNNSIQTLDQQSSFALYIAPSGLRCLIAGDNYLNSITDEPPENYEKLFNILKTFSDIDLIQNATLINQKRLWIKIHPSGFSSSNIAPVIANYLDDSLSTGKKFIYWPLELCFIQFPSDYTPGLSLDESPQLDTFSIDDPLQMIDEFMNVLDDIEKSKPKEENSLKLDDDTAFPKLVNDIYDKQDQKSEFKFPESFDFRPEIDMIDQQLKTEKIDSIDDIMKTDDAFDDLFDHRANEDLNLIDHPKETADTEFQKKLQEVFHNDDTIEKNMNNANQGDNGDSNAIISSEGKIESNFEDDWGDLFGDSADDDDDDKNLDLDIDTLENNEYVNKPVENSQDMNATNWNSNNMVMDKNDNDNDDDDNDNEPKDDNIQLEENKLSNEQLSNQLYSTFDTDTKQVTSNSPLNVVKQLNENQQLLHTSPLYQDPGAPSPIPFQIFASKFSPDGNTSSPLIEEKSVFKPLTSLTPKEKRKSIFSPLNFNPLIQKDIDSKYSNGGKFFVKHSKIEDIILDQTDELKKSTTTPPRSATPFISDSKFNLNLTTPSFLVRGIGQNSVEPTLPDDLISDSDDESSDVNQENKSNNMFPSIDDDYQNNRVDLNVINNDIDDDIENDGLSIIESDANHSDNQTGALNDSGFGNGKSSTGLGIFVSGTENSAKRRKLETIFDNLDADDDDDDELDLDLDSEDGSGDENQTEKGDQNVNPLAVAGNSEIINITGMEISEIPKDKDVSEINNIDIPNSWFYVLRPVAPIQIPFNFLNSNKMKVSKSKIKSLLPILQEYVLFSQKYMNNQVLDMLVQNRECPSVLDADIEYLLYKIFPGIGKVNCYELLDSEKESKQGKSFECLFGIHPPTSSYNKNFIGNQNLPDSDLKLFEDNNYASTSPMVNVPPSDLPQNQMLLQYSEDYFNELQNFDLADSISRDHLFRINSTVLNMKRLEQNIVVNGVGIHFWKMLNLEPLSGQKNFSLLFVIPKSRSDGFGENALHFLNSIISYYNVCNLGKIHKLNETGILEIDCKSGTRHEYWDNAQNALLSKVEELQNNFTLDQKNKVLLMFVDPFQDLNSLIRMADVTFAFESALVEKLVGDNDPLKKKKKRKNKVIARLPITLFYKAFSIDSFYLRDNGQFVIFTNEKYTALAVELYNNCPNGEESMILKDRSNVFDIAKDIQEKVKFVLTKKNIARSLVDSETFLHVCYERSVDKKWCVASWTDQTGSLNYTKSWCIDENIEGSQNFENVANDIMAITMEYVTQISGTSFVVLTRLNNIIPDDELAEWKRLSIKNNDVLLIVMTAELESSTLILSNNPGPVFTARPKDDQNKDTNYTVASTNSQSQTPGNGLFNTSTYTHLVESTKFESPDVSMYTPSYDAIFSPMDAGSHQPQVPIQPLQPLPEEMSNNSLTQNLSQQNQILIDISEECYGVILQVSQPLSNQPRVPLRTGFLINTGEGITKNRVLEINLLSCQSGINTTEFLKKLLIQYKNLSFLAPWLGMSSIVRKCGNVEFEDLGDEEDDDDGDWEDENVNSSNSLGMNMMNSSNNYVNSNVDRSERRREKHFLQQQYIQFHRMQQRQKRQRIREREKDILQNDTHCNVIPTHILTVRKMLDFLVNIEVE